MKTVITHFYNEEYLLPQWLKHHKNIFDHGVLIDYHSTDRSVEICREICPTWQVFTSMNDWFDARKCDYEVEFYERQIPGWRIALTVTEFLVGNVHELTPDVPPRVQWYIPGIRFTAWDPNGSLDLTKPFWEQHTVGVSYKTDPMAHQCRSFHNFSDITYPPGRHFLPHNTEDMMIFHYAHMIIGQDMLNRRLQIQHKISPNDRQAGLGIHHWADDVGLNPHKLYYMHKDWLSISETDCSDLIAKVTR